MLAQIGGIPGEVEVRSKEETEIAERDEPHVGRKEDSFPGSRKLRYGGLLDGSVGIDAADAGKLRAIDAVMILRKITIKKAEANRPHNTQRAENVKNRSPAER